MDRCPNCGAQIRSGARFCTTCGYRLSDAESASGPEPATEPAATTAPTTDEQTSDTANPTTMSATEQESTAEPAPSEQTQASGSGWPSSWGSWPNNQEQPTETSGDTAATNESAAPEPAAEQQSAASESREQEPAASESAEPAPNDRDVIELGPSADKAAAADTTSEPAATSAEEETATSPTAPAAGAQQPSLDQALSLLDQLRNLLPSLVAPQSNADSDAIADDLAAARTGGDSDESEKLDHLRQTIASAREQPRDIETALNLVGSLDAIAALQDRYDHLAAAVDRAIDRLQSDGNA